MVLLKGINGNFMMDPPFFRIIIVLTSITHKENKYCYFWNMDMMAVINSKKIARIFSKFTIFNSKIPFTGKFVSNLENILIS